MSSRSTRRTVLTAVLGLSLIALVGCSSGGKEVLGPDPGQAALLKSHVDRAPEQAGVDFTATARGLRALGHDLSTTLPSGSGRHGNQVFSPASLAIAFAMLREGAGAASGAEIDRVIGLPGNRQTAYNALLRDLADIGNGDRLEIADALFLDPGLKVRQAYLDAIMRWYGAGLHQTPFPAPALDQINSWVDRNTHGRIPHLLDQLDPTAVFALVNTIYLNAKWKLPFDAADTSSQAFRTADGASVSAKTMHQDATFDYATGDGWQAVRLPYAGGRLSMWVLLPSGSGDPKALLSPDLLAAAVERATPTEVALSLPRWDTETKADLVDVLKRLGMAETFTTGAFPGVTSDPRFTISDVVQQADITVGEKGTEAAAATAIVGETSARVPTGLTFTADHPFAYAIVHDPTGVPLFEGVVADPSAD